MASASEARDQLIAVLAAIPERVEALAAQAAAAGGASTNVEEWTPNEIAGHLCDSARYWGGRMRRVVNEDQPTLDVYDENSAVHLAAYRYKTLAPLLNELRVLSGDTVTFLRALPAEAWERAGTHPQRGALTLRQIVEIEAEHETMHTGQFARALGLQP